MRTVIAVTLWNLIMDFGESPHHALMILGVGTAFCLVTDIAEMAGKLKDIYKP